MNLEERINQTVAEFLESDAIEQKINAQIEKAVDGAMNELFSSYHAPVKEAIEIDDSYLSEDVEIEEKPEPTY